MQAIALMGISGTLWALLHFWLLPLMRDHWKAADMRAKAARAGLLVAAEKLRDLLFVSVLVVALVVLLVAIGNALGSTHAVWPKAVVEAAAASYSGAKALADGYASLLTGAGLLGAAIALWLAARHAKARVVEVWMAKAQAAHEALRSDPQTLEAAREDPELRPLVERIEQAVVEIRAQDDMEKPDEVRMANSGSQLSEALSMLAIESARKQVDFAAAAGIATKSERASPVTGWQRLARVLASERLGKDLGLVRKPMGWVITALLTVSLVGWAAEPMANSLQLAVNNLRIQVANQDAQRHLDEALSKTEKPAAKEAAEPVQAPVSAAAVQTTSRLLARAAVRDMRAPRLSTAAPARAGRPWLNRSSCALRSPINTSRQVFRATTT